MGWVTERFIVHAWKVCVPYRHREFESPPIREHYHRHQPEGKRDRLIVWVRVLGLSGSRALFDGHLDLFFGTVA